MPSRYAHPDSPPDAARDRTTPGSGLRSALRAAVDLVQLVLTFPFLCLAAIFSTTGMFSIFRPVLAVLRWSGLLSAEKQPGQSRKAAAPARRGGYGLREGLLANLFLRRAHATPGKERQSADTAGLAPDSMVTALKSPSCSAYSPASRLTRYPTTPSLPRPLVPKRQPSYSRLPRAEFGPQTKTLILDLDETLIHSRPKGSSMLSNHVIEVYSSQQDLSGNAVPVLFSVNKRPYCDEFLQKASKWYKLYAYTASTQAYADQLIDWLEHESKYFSGRLYRQHCKMTDHGFVKDISQIEPDLSKVMILDNTPLSYSTHEDNGIPISGWIDDQSDKSLLQLIPILESLQHVPDVRAFIGLRLANMNLM